MTSTTLAQIVVAAQAAANKAQASANPDTLTIETVKIEEFAATGFDRADYATFENAYNSQLQMLVNFSKQDSPATVAAKKAAAAAAAATGAPVSKPA